MDPLHPLRRHRRRPLYQANRADPSTYLATARLRLLRTIPQSHRLHSRILRNGSLKSSGQPPDIHRVPFTEAELAEIRLRRRHATDPEDVRYQLQDSKLVQMWNADYEHEEQWRDYEVARPAMEVKRDAAGLPEEMFHTDEVVGEKRRRVIPEGYPTKMVADGCTVEPTELEDGEIEEAGYVGDTDEMEDNEEQDEDQEKTLQSLKEKNMALRTANDMMRILAESIDQEKREAETASSSPLTAMSGASDSSEDGSGESDMAMCDFDLEDLDDEVDDIEDVEEDEDEDEEEEEESGARIPVDVDSSPNKVGSDSQASKKILAMQDESEETQSDHELG